MLTGDKRASFFGLDRQRQMEKKFFNIETRTDKIQNDFFCTKAKNVNVAEKRKKERKNSKEKWSKKLEDRVHGRDKCYKTF